jgi:hypothetical protein
MEHFEYCFAFENVQCLFPTAASNLKIDNKTLITFIWAWLPYGPIGCQYNINQSPEDINRINYKVSVS